MIYNIAGSIDNENTWKLAHIALGQAHQVTLGHCRYAFKRYQWREKLPGLHPAEVECAVEPAVGIGGNGKWDIELVYKIRCLLNRSHSDQQNLRTSGFETIFFPAQLRHLLPAEGSAVMTQKHQNQGFVVPEFTESFFWTHRIRSLPHPGLWTSYYSSSNS